ncbi:MAG TPA: KH domain-containing protein [Verrucomicrobiae bacterium]|nr:KH domain-containing protein [Verrucomicrobiae bacterium]
MTFNGSFRVIKVAKDRIGAIVGKKGSVKLEIESKCNVKLNIDGESGDVSVELKNNDASFDIGIFKAMEIITAISKGFSPERSYNLLKEDIILQFVDLREYSGKSVNSLDRIKSRIIGQSGKTRKNIEDFTSVYLSVYGHFVGFIGNYEETKLAVDAIIMLCRGSSHKSVYHMLEEYRRKKKQEKMELWENGTFSK